MVQNKDKRIHEIDTRITDLTEHMIMWRKAGGVGGGMAMHALSEIKELELEKYDLINGTNKLEILRTQKKLNSLRILRDKAKFIKRFRYNSEIKEVEGKLKILQNKQTNFNVFIYKEFYVF